MMNQIIETHPLAPFMPPNACLLFLGSFPPPMARWRMAFYYPNFNNDFWRIMGLIFFRDQNYFINTDQKCFYQDKIEHLLTKSGIAISDTAYQVVRLQGNASDKFLQVTMPMNLDAILDELPYCKTLITTGEKAAQIVCQQYEVPMPKIGQSVGLIMQNRHVDLYRAPSSSRAYPLALDKKAEIYRQIFAKTLKCEIIDSVEE